MLPLLVFFLVLTFPATASDEEYLPESVLLDRHFLMFRRGDNRRLLEDTRLATESKNYNQSSRLNPAENFRRIQSSTEEGLRSMVRSYIRELTSSTYYVAPTARFPDADPSRMQRPVLHFEDGNGAHHLLIRVSSQRFDLVVLRPSNFEEGEFSSQKIEKYPLSTFIELARLSKNRVLGIAVYEEDTNNPPRLSGRQIPIDPVDLLALEEEDRSRSKQSTSQDPNSLKEAPPGFLESFQIGLMKARSKESAYLKERKSLVRMRLPWLDISQAETVEQLNVIVQGAIIERIFEPDPKPQHCPGKLKNGRCIPTTEFSDRTWRLYRQLYRLDDVAGDIFDARI